MNKQNTDLLSKENINLKNQKNLTEVELSEKLNNMSELLILSKQNVESLSKEINQLKNTKNLTEAQLNEKINNLD